MIFSQERNDIRQQYFSVWKKYQNKLLLSPLEQQILAVILDHPEYHSFLSKPETIDKDYSPENGESNPFLHMGLHLAIREQESTDRPLGIKTLYASYVKKHKGCHLSAEHEMLEALVEQLWLAQKYQKMPDESLYLQKLREGI